MTQAAVEVSLLDIADRLLERLKRSLPSGCQAELYLSRGRERSIEMRDGEIETLQESSDEGMGLRVLKDGRMGFANAGGLDFESLDFILPQVLSQLPFTAADEFRAFAELEKDPRESDPKSFAETVDPTLFLNAIQNQAARIKNLEALALQSDKRVKKVLRAGYGESTGDVVIVNTLGVRRHEAGTGCSVGLSAVAEKQGQVQVGSGSQSARFFRHLDFDKVAKDAAWRAGALIDARKLPTAKRDVVFDPWVAPEFLELLSGALSADQVQRGKSLFKGKMGKTVASAAVTLIDDPRRKFGIGSSAFDDEGVPTRRKVMVEEGVLKEFFYDTYTARKDKRQSNGSAGRASYRGVPSPSTSNFYLEAGKLSREQLIQDTKSGILVLEALGMHTADPVSGEFSVGVSGVAIENGRLTHGVRAGMISGNISELLQRIDAVADDLTFYSSLAAPTFRVADMTVA